MMLDQKWMLKQTNISKMEDLRIWNTIGIVTSFSVILIIFMKSVSALEKCMKSQIIQLTLTQWLHIHLLLKPVAIFKWLVEYLNLLTK